MFAILNAVRSLRQPLEVVRSSRAIEALVQKFRAIAAQPAGDSQQRYLSFVYGFKKREEFPLFAYLAVRSAQMHNPGARIVFCHLHEPFGPWWDRLKPDITTVESQDFTFFKGSRFYHYAHKADVVRLLMLRELGGVYLDIDTISTRPFDDLFEDDFGMAVQAAGPHSAAGLCNAVMWSKPNSAFCRLWIDQYSYFRSKGQDAFWDFHSVKLPGIMARDNPDLINILHHRAFFYPLWTDIERILFSERGDRYLQDLEVAYGFHLWNGGTSDILNSITPEWVQSSKSAYAHFARPVMTFADLRAGATS